MLYGPGHRVHMSRRSCDSLGDHSSLQVVYPGGKISGFTDDRAKGRSENSLGLFFHHRYQSIPHNLLVNFIEGIGCAFRIHIHAFPLAWFSITIYSKELIEAVKWAGTIVEVSSSAMTAGPTISAPGSKSNRQ